jgi:methyl-accepting chemotaxis protein
MRTNLPVSNKEIPLGEETLIVSKTNLKGQLTYINRDFIDISGFSEAELIGEPHNIVRHPDMPPEAFADLWETLKAGRPWTGMVKNRCKNGDHYWVLANATPLVEGGQTVGYLSVRRRATRSQIEEAEEIYRRFREHRQGKLRIRQGQVVQGEGGVLARLTDRPLGQRLGLIFGLIALMLVIQGMAGVVALDAIANTDASTLQTLIGQIRWATLGGVLLSLALIAVAGRWLAGSLLPPINEAARTLGLIAQGNYSSAVDVSGNDELGQLRQQLQSMQTRMGFELAETRRVAAEMTGIKIALDSVHMPVQIADDSGRITYANKTMLEAMGRVEDALGQRQAGFRASQLVGNEIGLLHGDHGTTRHLAELRHAETRDIDIAGRAFRVTTTPVIDSQGKRLGTAGEWQDRTDEIQVENEVAAIVAAASQGDLSRRIALDGKEGFFARLGEGVNHLLHNTQQALQTTSEALNRVARGDLTQTIAEDYQGIFGQLKDDTNQTIERLREVIGQIKEAAEAIDTAAHEIASGNQDLSSRTEEQASSLEQTSSSMEQLNATVQQNADNASQANALARQSNDVASRGGQMVRRVVDTMSDIQDSSKKIADIVGVIDSIAFQTNILALNAAVEAARAGEQGRGFAVVASEVRSLAQRSATAAKEIKMLIAESVDKVEGGAKLVREAGSTMDEVVVSFQQVAGLVTDISNASREQSQGIGQVTEAVSQMDETTQQNAALVEQAAAAAESLEEQARSLVKAVATFRLAAGGSSRPAARLAPSVASAPSARSRHHKPAALLPLQDEIEEWEEF